MVNTLRIVYAGDRDISVSVLRFIIRQGVKPISLLTSDGGIATHAQKLMEICNYLDDSLILKGNQFRTKSGINLLKELGADYIISVHFPHIFPNEVLKIPRYGVLNLHPAYLPYNRGWHTPTWAIWEGTPYGATLHFMEEEIDRGDIIHQKQQDILPEDTADTLYKRVKKLELEVFKEAWSYIESAKYTRKPQGSTEGTRHNRVDIASLQCVDLDAQIKAGDLIRLLRALTTNKINESAYFRVYGNLYRMQLSIVKEEEQH